MSRHYFFTEHNKFVSTSLSLTHTHTQNKTKQNKNTNLWIDHTRIHKKKYVNVVSVESVNTTDSLLMSWDVSLPWNKCWLLCHLCYCVSVCDLIYCCCCYCCCCYVYLFSHTKLVNWKQKTIISCVESWYFLNLISFCVIFCFFLKKIEMYTKKPK